MSSSVVVGNPVDTVNSVPPLDIRRKSRSSSLTSALAHNSAQTKSAFDQIMAQKMASEENELQH